MDLSRITDTNYLARYHAAMKTADREIEEFITRAKLDVQRAENIQRYIKMIGAPTIVGVDRVEPNENDSAGASTLRKAMERVDKEEEASKPAVVPLAKAAKG